MKTRNMLVVTLLAFMALIPSLLKAQTLASTERYLGYITNDKFEVDSSRFNKAGTYSICSMLEEDVLDKYVGCKVVGMRVGVSVDLGRTRNFLYSISAEGEVAPVVEQKQKLSRGWNVIRFNGDGYEIKAGESLFYGYDYTETDEMVEKGYGALAFSGNAVSNGFYLFGDFGSGEGLYPVTVPGNLCVQLIVDVSNLPTHDLNITYLDTGFKHKKAGEVIEMLAYFTNVGRDTTYTYQCGYQLDEAEPVLFTVKDVVPDGQMSDAWKVDVALPNDMPIGLHTLKAFVTKVNGEPLHAASTRDTLTSSFGVYRDSLPRTKVYLEVYNDQRTPYSAMFNNVVKMAENSYMKDHIVIANIHQPKTTLAVEEANYLHYLYTYTTPMFTINRAYFPGEPSVAYDVEGYLGMGESMMAEIVADMLYQDFYSPTFATIDLKETFNPDTRELTVEASGQLLPEAEAIYGDLGVTLLITENSVKAEQYVYNSLTQRTTRNANYVHQHVLRGYMTSPLGDVVTPQEGTYSKSVSMTLPNSWNLINLQVVGFISKKMNVEAESAEALGRLLDKNVYDLDVLDVNVLNMNQDPVVGISAVTAKRMQTDRFYSLDGKTVDMNTQRTGIYLKRAADGSVRKVLVK